MKSKTDEKRHAAVGRLYPTGIPLPLVAMILLRCKGDFQRYLFIDLISKV